MSSDDKLIEFKAKESGCIYCGLPTENIEEYTMKKTRYHRPKKTTITRKLAIPSHSNCLLKRKIFRSISFFFVFAFIISIFIINSWWILLLLVIAGFWYEIGEKSIIEPIEDHHIKTNDGFPWDSPIYIKSNK